MKKSVYLFELRSIQSFLFASGRLSDLVDGSELLDYLMREPLDNVFQVCGIDSDKQVLRRAGGAMYVHCNDIHQGQRLRNLWRAFVLRILPGIESVDALMEQQDNEPLVDLVKRGMDSLQAARNHQRVSLPVPGPLAARAQRTGLAAVKQSKKELIDQNTQVKRLFGEWAEEKSGVAQRFEPDSEERFQWPRTFEADGNRGSAVFPLNDNRLVGIIHADGNGLGMVLQALTQAMQGRNDDDYRSLMQEFSWLLEKCTCSAAELATREVLYPAAAHGVLPARPIVLGGDDVTLVTRADLALPFLQVFAAEFERQTQAQLAALNERFSIPALPDNLTIGAGVTYLKANQPFAQGYEIAEALCGLAKKDSARNCSAVAFHKIQSSFMDNLDALRDREFLIRGEGSESFHLSLGTYSIGNEKTGELPRLETLFDVAGLFGRSPEDYDTYLNDRSLREIATSLAHSIPLAKNQYQRWHKLASAKVSKGGLARWEEKGKQLLNSAMRPDLPVASVSTTDSGRQIAYSFLGDLISLLTLQPELRKRAEAHGQTNIGANSEVQGGKL